MAAFTLGVLCLIAALGLGAAPQVSRRRNRRRIRHLLFRPTSRALLTLILIAGGLFSFVAGLLGAFESLNNEMALAALGAAAVATVGWIYTSHQSRRLSLISHTQDLIAQHRTSQIYETHRRNVMRKFPVGVSLSETDADKILAQSDDREEHWSERPPLYYSIQQTLNFHEYIASGVRHDRLDEETIERYQKAILVGAVGKFLPLIRRFRKSPKRPYGDIHWVIQYWYDVDIDDENAAVRLENATSKEKRTGNTQKSD